MPTTRVYPYQLLDSHRWIWFFTRWITGGDGTYTGPGWKVIEAQSRNGGALQSTPSGGTGTANLPDANAWNSSHASNADGARLWPGDWIVLESNRGGSNTECQIYIKWYQPYTGYFYYAHFYLLPLADYVAGTNEVDRNIDFKGLGMVVLGSSTNSMDSGFANCIGGNMLSGDLTKNMPMAGLYNLTDGEGAYHGYESGQAGTTYNKHYWRTTASTYNGAERFSCIGDEATINIWWTNETYAYYLHFGLFDSIYAADEDKRPFLSAGGYTQYNPLSAGVANRYSTGQITSGSHCLRLQGDSMNTLRTYPGQPFGKKPILPIGLFSIANSYKGFMGYMRLMYLSNDNMGLMGTLQSKNYSYIRVATSNESIVFPWDGVTDL